MSKGYLEQTAIAYDMPLYEVERIHRFYPDNFYEKLEEYITERSKNE